MKCHDLTRLPMTRETPSEGVTICRRWVRPNVSVSFYRSVGRHRKEVFGEDVDVFWPERWLVDTKKVTQMMIVVNAFGSGKYSCLRRNISMPELLEFVPSLRWEFEVGFKEVFTEYGGSEADYYSILTCRTRKFLGTWRYTLL